MIQLLIDSIENQLGIIEAEQQRAGPALFLRWQQMMPTGNRACSFAKSLRA
jgi:hypothetical protein